VQTLVRVRASLDMNPERARRCSSASGTTVRGSRYLCARVGADGNLLSAKPKIHSPGQTIERILLSPWAMEDRL
jgi:hypothetical protein